MWTSSLSWRIEESGDPSELASEHLLPVQFTELLQRPSGRTPELRLMAAVLEDAIRSFCQCASSQGMAGRRPFQRTPNRSPRHVGAGPCPSRNVRAVLLSNPH